MRKHKRKLRSPRYTKMRGKTITVGTHNYLGKKQSKIKNNGFNKKYKNSEIANQLYLDFFINNEINDIDEKTSYFINHWKEYNLNNRDKTKIREIQKKMKLVKDLGRKIDDIISIEGYIISKPVFMSKKEKDEFIKRVMKEKNINKLDIKNKKKYIVKEKKLRESIRKTLEKMMEGNVWEENL